MSINLHVYVGAYALVPHSLQDRVVGESRCSNLCGNTHIKASMRFCPSCGAPVEKGRTVVQTLRPTTPSSVKDSSLADECWVPESGQGNQRTLWLPNHRGMGTTYDGSHTRPDALEDFNPRYFEDAKLRFAERYAPLLAAVKAELGVEPIIQAGVVEYYN